MFCRAVDLGLPRLLGDCRGPRSLAAREPRTSSGPAATANFPVNRGTEAAGSATKQLSARVCGRVGPRPAEITVGDGFSAISLPNQTPGGLPRCYIYYSRVAPK